MQRNTEKCREMQRNTEKYRELQINAEHAENAEKYR